VPEFRRTAWENIRVRDVMDMTPGLHSEENETRSDPNSIASQQFALSSGYLVLGFFATKFSF